MELIFFKKAVIKQSSVVAAYRKTAVVEANTALEPDRLVHELFVLKNLVPTKVLESNNFVPMEQGDLVQIKQLFWQLCGSDMVPVEEASCE